MAYDNGLIQLTQGQWALVDECDYKDLSKHKWQAWWNKCTGSFYAKRSLKRAFGSRPTEYMHRVIHGMVSGDKKQVDHINHDTLDNRRENTRVGNARLNSANQRNQSECGSGVRLKLRKKKHRYEAYAWIGCKQFHVGTFDTPDMATTARNEWLLERNQT